MVSRIFELPVKSASAVWYWSIEFAKKCCGAIEGLASLLHTLLHTDETKLIAIQGNKQYITSLFAICETSYHI
ncbi:MAG: hypothetical protein HZB66_02530 [Candidatus Aenigmarchaeota archaeon]|nr:hypothetical protein [Candidatus Aenigmarchaeota archaeon]